MTKDNQFCRSYSTHGCVGGFDSLFPDGHKITWPGKSPLIILLRGTEGSGKSTLALQLACLGNSQEETDLTCQHGPPHSRCVLYYVVDDYPERIRQKFDVFRVGGHEDARVEIWKSERNDILTVKGRGPSLRLEQLKRVHLRDDTTYLFLIDYRGKKNFSDVRRVIRNDVNVADEVFPECAVVLDSVSRLGLPVPTKGEDNYDLSEPDRIEYFLSDYPKTKPSIIIIVDEESSQLRRDPYLTDVFISLRQINVTEKHTRQYCERDLQIVKAANCIHVRGRQKFRIIPNSGIQILPSLTASAHTLDNKVKSLGRFTAGGNGRDKADFCLSGLGEDQRILKGSSSVISGYQSLG